MTEKSKTTSVRPIEYGHDEPGGKISLPTCAPFDGQNCLIKLAKGWVEAWWEPSSFSDTESGREWEGFHWVCLDDDFTAELDDARFWMPLPEEPNVEA